MGLEFISRRMDAVVWARSVIQGEFLLLTEVQLRYHREMPFRMNGYAGLVEEKYRVRLIRCSSISFLPQKPRSFPVGRSPWAWDWSCGRTIV